MKDYYPTRMEKEDILDRVDPVIYGKPVGEYSLKPEEASFYEQNGFIIFPNFFSEEEVNEFNNALFSLKNAPELKEKEEYITEPDSDEVRTIFSQHLFHPIFNKLMKDRRIVDKIEHILGSNAYIHHSRINIKPAYKGKSFPWHSDFETWHAEDGLPRCRVLTAWIMLTDNTHYNGPLYLIPGSHKKFVSCAGKTPKDNYKQSLKKQEYGVPSLKAIKHLSKNTELVAALGKKGTLVFHDGNIMHGSPDNISPYDRTNAFFVYNSVENTPVEPFAAKHKRAPFLSLDDYTPL
ncbi:phytanoyl-CoA dioxygenase family protein [Hydrogenimonas thermophila]|uniref:Ectoine hydroxylase n=1 Tax=Hydrogenimonas thermophila TaxID=223786 RepID=A0A1I5UQZ6_9BACT|nr:phytanoyl-CoA dioxygenase family protein [Hydrogenimonas thermophila]SFP97467.1 ectoine hydroxylase [Hydrogenimonas thermophila]